jgi:hypothetical protein
MKRGKILATTLAIAGMGMLAFGATTAPASAQVYAAPAGCAAGYYYANGYCYPYQPAPPPVAYYPPAYYAPPPVIVGPAIGIGFGFGGFRGGGGHFHH